MNPEQQRAVSLVQEAAYDGRPMREILNIGRRNGLDPGHVRRLVDAVNRAVERERVLQAWEALNPPKPEPYGIPPKLRHRRPRPRPCP